MVKVRVRESTTVLLRGFSRGVARIRVKDKVGSGWDAANGARLGLFSNGD